MSRQRDIKEFQKKFQDARYFQQDRFDKYVELTAFYEGEQQQLSNYAGGKPWVVDINTPYAADAIDIRVSSLQANDYLGDIEPLSPDDTEKIENLNEAKNTFWKFMDLDEKISDSIHNGAMMREAYIHIIVDGDVFDEDADVSILTPKALKAYALDPTSVLIDPNALDYKDAEYLIITERISTKRAMKEYGLTKQDLNQASDSKQDRGETFLGTNYDSPDGDMITKLTFYERYKDKETNQFVVDRIEIIGEKIVFDKTLNISVYPIAQFRWQKRKKSAYGLSLMDRVLGLQKSVNAIESATTNTALQFAAPSFAVSKSSGVNAKRFSELVGSPGLVVSVQGDPRSAITPLVNQKVDPELVAVKRDHEDTIYKIAGVTEQFKGNIGTAGNTRSGSEQAINRAKIQEQMVIRNIQGFIEDLTVIIVEYITKLFSGLSMWVRGEKDSRGKYNFKELEISEDVENIRYTFAVNLDVKTPHSREKSKTLLKELYTFENQYDSDVKVLTILDIIKQYDLPNRQELVERYQQLMSKTNKDKAQVLIEWVTVTEEYGIDAALITQGIMEILEGKETPTVDQIISQIQQIAEQEEQQQVSMESDRAMQEAEMQQQMMMEQEQQMMGQEQMMMEEEVIDTGLDEVIDTGLDEDEEVIDVGI